MTDELIMQYLGFQAKALVREYTFAVRDLSSEPLQYTLTIANEAFVAHRVRYQDAPEICLLRLRRELIAYSNHPPMSQFCITDMELADYLEARKTKAPHKFQRPEPQY